MMVLPSFLGPPFFFLFTLLTSGSTLRSSSPDGSDSWSVSTRLQRDKIKKKERIYETVFFSSGLTTTTQNKLEGKEHRL